MAISPLHNKDKNEDCSYKKAHYHVMYVAKNPVTTEAIRNRIKRTLGNNSISYVEIIDGIRNVYDYLTHESKDAIAKKKQKYDKKDIVTINGFDIDRYITLDESEKKELRQTLIVIVDDFNIVNVKNLSAFISQKGSGFGIDSMKYVNEIISSSSGIFRLYFDANYQCGYRPIYSKSINPETGETK